MNLTNDDESKKQDAKESVECDATYIKFKERKKQNISLGMHI